MNEVPARDSRAIALSIARIEGMLSARLPSIEAGIAANAQALVDHVRESDTRRDDLHSRINTTRSVADRLDERLSDVEERQSSQLGRTAQVVAVAGGLLGLVALVIPNVPT